jgi:hypothetical protein
MPICLNREINGAPQVSILSEAHAAKVTIRSPSEKVPGFTIGQHHVPTVPMSDMTPIQRKRFAYFRQLRMFITNMTNICESLR